MVGIRFQLLQEENRQVFRDCISQLDIGCIKIGCILGRRYLLYHNGFYYNSCMPRKTCVLVVFALTACQAVNAPALSTQTPPVKAIQTAATPTPTAANPSPPVNETGFQVMIHPDDGVFVGDLVSFEISSPPGQDMQGQTVSVILEEPVNLYYGPEEFRPSGIGEVQQATLSWVWDTSGYSPGDYQFTFSILPDGAAWQQQVTLFPQNALPGYAHSQTWLEHSLDCCQIYYLEGTAADRDISSLALQIEDNARVLNRRFRLDLDDPIRIILLPRMMGHGGLARDVIYVSYLDRNYAGDHSEIVLFHEMAHIYDLEAGGGWNSAMFLEGFAVYLAGGHFKPEPLVQRAAALLAQDRYIPLPDLINDFYFHQHETGYIIAGALVTYMVDRWGADRFEQFYFHKLADQNSQAGQREQVVDALIEVYGLDLSQLDHEFQFFLQSVDPGDQLQDVPLSILYFDTLRRYQKLLDPSAYFLDMWVVPFEMIEDNQNIPDALRHPSGLENLALETMLIDADRALADLDYLQAGELLGAVNQVLDRIEQGEIDPLSANTYSETYLKIVTMLTRNGYEPQEIRLDQLKNSAQVWVTNSGLSLLSFDLIFSEGIWLFE